MRPQDERYLNAVDHALDGQDMSGDLEIGTAAVIDKLRYMVVASTSGTRWRPDMSTSREHAVIESPSPWTKLSRPARRGYAPVPYLATVAVLFLIAALTAFVARNSDPGQDSLGNFALAPATPAVPRYADDCVDSPQNQPFPPGYAAGSIITAPRSIRAAPNAPIYNISVVDNADLPSGNPIEQSTYPDVVQTVSERFVCRSALENGWEQAMIPVVDGNSMWRGWLWDTEPVTLDVHVVLFPMPSPAIASVEDLGNGYIGVLLSTDSYGFGVAEYDVFSTSDGDLTLVDSAFAASANWIDTTQPARIPTENTLQLWDTYLSPNLVALQADAPTELEVQNLGGESRVITIPALGISLNLAPGETSKVSVDAPAGRYDIKMFPVSSDSPIVVRTLLLLAPDLVATPVS